MPHWVEPSAPTLGACCEHREFALTRNQASPSPSPNPSPSPSHNPNPNPNPNPNQTRLRTELYGSGGVASADLAAALGPQRGEFETLTLP